MTRRNPRHARRSPGRTRQRGVLALILAVGALVPATNAKAAGPGYVTLQFGRSQWVTTDTACVPRPNAVPLDVVAQQLHDRGLSGTGTIVVNRTQENDRLCWSRYTLQPSWADLSRLRDEFAWSFISDGMTHNDITTMTPEQQQQESCGSLPFFISHGHDRASGLYAYGNNKFTTQIQRDVVSTCFAYGRTYAGGRNVRAKMLPPWFQKTNSITGGRCNDPVLPCYTMAVTNSRRYMLPNRLVELVKVNADEWVVIQMYRFVAGARTAGAGQRWDCSSADPTKHWTTDPETYCLQDFLFAVDQIPVGTIVADPATIAQAWRT
jgi:hypothetical protein